MNATARLNSFRRLAPGWDSYNAPPPSAESIAHARDFCHTLAQHRAEPYRVNPTVVGGVGVTIKRDHAATRSVYVEFRNTGNAHAAFIGAGPVRVTTVEQSPEGYAALLAEAAKHLRG